MGRMTTLVAMFVAVVLAKAIVALLVGWLSRAEWASWLYVACLVNTVLGGSFVLAINQFRRDGLAVSSVFFAVLMFWLAHGAAKRGAFAGAVMGPSRM